MTITELAETYGKKPDTLWRKAKALLPPPSGGKWSIYSVVTEDEARIILGDYPAPSPAKSKTVTDNTSGEKPAAPVTRAKQKPPAPRWKMPDVRTVRRAAFDTTCLLIVVGHAALIWYDCAKLWQVAGQIGGGIAFLFVLGCVLVATDPSRNLTSLAAIWMMVGLDIAAWWVHFPVFSAQMTDPAMLTQTKAICGVICALSFGAFYLYRDEKID